MPCVPGYESDVFISYCHRDDEAVSGDGWVTRFHNHLRVALSPILDTPPAIWRDTSLDPSHGLTPELERQVRGAAVLVAVISPAYLASRWCEWELEGFVGGACRKGPLWVDTKCRGIKVVHQPAVDGAHQTRVVPDVIGIEFFETDANTRRYFDVPFDSELQQRRIARLAQDIRDLLHAMRKSRTIFVGAATGALEAQRTKVREELEARQFRVLTSGAEIGEGATAAIRAALDNSSMAIHFVERGERPVDAAVAEAIDDKRVKAGQPLLKRVLVVHEDGDEQHRAFLDAPAIPASNNTEVLVNPLTHALKETVLETATRPAPAAASPHLIRVYLVCDQADHPLLDNADARRLRDHLLALGFEVKVPLADRSSQTEFSRDNRAKLKQCDGVLLYWGSAKQRWFEQRLLELTAAVGWRRREFVANAGYLAGPEEPLKKHYATREVHELIKAFEPDSNERLDAFVARLGGGSPA